MIGFLWRLIVGRFHGHTWTTEERRELVDRRDLVIGQTVYLRCTKCGDWKRRRLA